MTGGLARWAPLGGLIFVAAWIVSLVLILDSPDLGDSDAKILAYFGDHSNRVQHFVAFFLVSVGLMFFLWFLSAVRSRLSAAEGGPGRLTALATTAGTAFITLVTLATILDFSYAATVADTHRFSRHPNLFRLVSDLGYLVFVLSLFAAAVFIWAVSSPAWRTRILPRWLAGIGFFVGATCLVGFTGVPGLIFAAWLLLLSGYLTWSQTAPAPVATS
jgi:hypothetical protein